MEQGTFLRLVENPPSAWRGIKKGDVFVYEGRGKSRYSRFGWNYIRYHRFRHISTGQIKELGEVQRGNNRLIGYYRQTGKQILKPLNEL